MQTQLYTPGAGESAIQTFDFNGLTLRALLLEGEPWFMGSDVASALEYRDAPTLLRGLDDDETRLINVSQNTTQITRGNPNKTFVSESGLYAAILSAKTERVKPFKRWVTHDVLPAIRRTGAYDAPKTLEERSLALLGELTAVVAEQKAELEVARPKVATYDKVLTPEHTFGFRDLTKAVRDKYPVNEADIKRLLTQKGVIIPGRRLDVYSAAIDKGYAVRRASGKWGGKERFQARFTTKTLEWLLAELAPLEEVA